MDQPNKADAQKIEQDHGSSVNSQIQDIGGRAEYGCAGNANQHSSADVLEEELGIHHAHHPGKAEHNGHFKDDCQAQNNGQEQLGIGINGDGCVESRAVATDQKIHRHREDDLISEISSTQKKPHGEKKERQNEALLIAIKPG